jgi:HlyD family secretion protein
VEGPLELVASVDERYLSQLQPGQRARVLADAYPQQPFEASLERLAPLVDAQRGAVQVWLRPQGQVPGFLREDMTLSVELLTAERERALAVPLSALRQDGGSQGRVAVLEAGRVVERTLRLGLRSLDRVEVQQGLQAGEQLLLDPRLDLGARVRGVPAPAAAAPARAATGGNPMAQAVGGGAR